MQYATAFLSLSIACFAITTTAAASAPATVAVTDTHAGKRAQENTTAAACLPASADAAAAAAAWVLSRPSSLSSTESPPSTVDRRPSLARCVFLANFAHSAPLAASFSFIARTASSESESEEGVMCGQ